MASNAVGSRVRAAVGIGALLIAGGCSPWLVLKYDSDSRPGTIPLSASIDEFAVEGVSGGTLKKGEAFAEPPGRTIARSFLTDFSANRVFSRVEWGSGVEDVDVRILGKVTQVETTNEPWGCLWFPFVYVGAPLGRTLLELSLRVDARCVETGKTVVSIEKYGRETYWAGLYYNNVDQQEVPPRFNAVLKRIAEEVKGDLIRSRGVFLKECPHAGARVAARRVPARESAEAGGDEPSPPAAAGAETTAESGQKVGSAFLARMKKTTIKVAVMDLRNKGAGRDLASNVSDLVSGQVRTLGLGTVISGDDIRTMVEFSKKQVQFECDRVSCMAEIGGALGVDFLVAGSVGRLGKAHILTLQLVDTNHAAVVAGVQKTLMGDPEEFIPTVERAVLLLFSPK